MGDNETLYKSAGDMALTSTMAYAMSKMVNGKLESILNEISIVSQRISRNEMKIADRFSPDREEYKENIRKGLVPYYTVCIFAIVNSDDGQKKRSLIKSVRSFEDFDTAFKVCSNLIRDAIDNDLEIQSKYGKFYDVVESWRQG